MEQLERQAQREAFSQLGWALISSQLLTLGLSMLGSIGGSLLMSVLSPLRGTWQMVQGYVVIIAVVMGALPLVWLGQRSGKLERILDRGEKVWPAQFILYFLLILGLQISVALLTAPLIALLESIGLSFVQANQSATSFSDSASLLFYSIAVAPICEELIYRGVVLRYLEHHGRWFAICISALLFALMHGNAVQFPIALVIGLVFGFLALKYSLHLTILLHVMNNLFVELIGRLSALHETAGNLVNAGLLIAGMATIVLMLLSSARPLVRDLRNNKTPRQVYANFFTCMPVVAIFVYLLALTVSSVIA